MKRGVIVLGLLVIVVGLLAVGCTAAPTISQTTSIQSGQPKLVLVLSIDQMRFDYLGRFDPVYKGGLRTLLDRGAVFTNANYRHAATETGPGHSVILTGRHPSHSGIVANDWYDAYLHAAVNVVDDPVQKPLGGAGRSASPANALSFTIGDVLKATSPESKVVAVAEGSIRDSHGRPASRRCLLVRNEGRQLHYEHLLHA
jgi:predicted AlkP superfamily pyrophosphatase or phosphodiesterase